MHRHAHRVAAALAVLACHPRPSGPAPRAPTRCEGGERADPAPEVLPAVEAPRSRVALTAAVTRARLERELTAAVPELLASGQEDVGAPGVVGYVVRRGPLAVALDDDRLEVTTRVAVAVQVSKRLGPLSVVYGRCNPTVDAWARMPLLLGTDYEAGEPSVTVKVVQGCVVAGYDATPEVQRSAREAAAVARGRIDREVPRIRPLVEAGWASLHRTVAVSANGCVRISPETVAQARPTEAGGVLRVGAEVTGRVLFERPCAPSPTDPPPALPPLARPDAIAPGVELATVVLIPWSEVGAALDEALGAGPTQLEARGARVEGQPRVLVGATRSQGSCPQRSWITAEPWFDAGSRRLRLREATPWSGGDRRGRAARSLADELQASFALPLPLDLAALGGALDRTLKQLVPEPPEGVTLDVDLAQPRVSAVTVAKDGIAATVVVTGRAELRAE